jgi:DNA-binding transcriptional ArsR family regulator
MAFEPVGSLAVTEPSRIKCFADPLRVRILTLLAEREATNQQIADALGQPQAKVLYHLRYLQRARLIRIVRRRVRGPNVEKFYRAVARTFDLRVPDALRPGVLNAELETLAANVADSARRHPGTPPRILIRRGVRSPDDATRFFERLKALIDEEWSVDHGAGTGDGATHYIGLALYRADDDGG